METLKKISGSAFEVRTPREDDVVTLHREDIEKDIAKCEETIARNKRWLAQLDA